MQGGGMGMGGMTPQIILLREGVDSSQGIGQIVSNINACTAVADSIRTTLGPRGLDKLITKNNVTTISNDGATVLGLLDVVHPAAKSLVDIARAQDAEVGDGTTSVTILAGALLSEAKRFVEDGMHSTVLVRGYRRAAALCMQTLKEIAVDVSQGTDEERRDMLIKCAATALNSKLIAHQKDFFADIVVRAVMTLEEPAMDLANVGIKKVTGGEISDTQFIDGVAFKKTYSYAGFEQQPKKLVNPKILCLNLELELKAEKDNAELRIEDPAKYQEFVDAEWKIIYDKLDAIVDSGAHVVLSRLAIGDLATQYFADRGIFSAGRVPDEDLKRTCRATGAVVQTTVNGLEGASKEHMERVLGSAKLFEEKQTGAERFNYFTGCEGQSTCTIILRGGGESFIDEAERSMHDSIMIARRARKHQQVVAGGGATEMILATRLKQAAKKIYGKEQLIVGAFARALEIVPVQLADNAGFDPTDVLSELRAAHHGNDSADGPNWTGLDIDTGSAVNTFERFVWEPVLVKQNAITGASEAACLILGVDETIKGEDLSQGHDAQAVQQAGRAMGRY